MNTMKQKWFRAILLLAVAYLIVGFGFATIGNTSATVEMRNLWRLAAWVVSAVAYLAHIWYEQFRLQNSPRTTALHTSSAAATASFGLAVSANIHAQFVSSSNPTMLALSLVLWPLLTMIPAFVVAFVIALGLARWRKKS
jgi:hypothetical protein